MKINLIIGAGQLGSRHLQGLIKLTQEQVVYVLDPSNDSLSIAKQRAEEIPHNHSIIFLSSWDNLPQEFDLVIVATGANVREKVVTQLLKNFRVNNLVLEKILFQDIEAYHNIDSLLKKTKTPTWVNHPRRMMLHYQQIKNEIAKTKERVVFQVIGGNWGLACNSLHFIDLCSFLTGEIVEEIDLNWLDKIIHKSKRENYIEFTGSVKGRMKDNSSFIITSFDEEISDITISISSSSQRWIIQEGRAQKNIYLAKNNNFNEEVTIIKTAFQSTLTTKIVTDLFELGNCDLPTYEEAFVSHVPFIKEALNKYIEITGIETNTCPIT